MTSICVKSALGVFMRTVKNGLRKEHHRHNFRPVRMTDYILPLEGGDTSVAAQRHATQLGHGVAMMCVYVLEVLDNKPDPRGSKLTEQDTKHIAFANKDPTTVQQTATHEQTINGRLHHLLPDLEISCITVCIKPWCPKYAP